MAEPAKPLLSIVVPFRNELKTLKSGDSKRFPPYKGVQWIFVDGGSNDGGEVYLRELWQKDARSDALTLIGSHPGRAKQMNAGAEHANGDYLLFLHIDTYLPESFDRWLACLAQKQPVWGFFPLRLDGSHRVYRLIEGMISWRSGCDHLATGDQAQFVARAVFEDLGGFPDLPIMEDRELSRALRRRSKPWVYSDPVLSSSRRWQQNGVWRTVLLMWVMKWRWRMGAKPDDLARCYQGNRLF